MISFRSIRKEITEQRSPASTFPFGSSGNLQTLREELKSQPHLVSLIREIQAFAHFARTTDVPALTFARFQAFDAQGTRQEYEEPYFERRGRLLALTLDVLLEDTPGNKEALEDLIWEICNEYTWCLPACLPHGFAAATNDRLQPESQVDLFAAETSHALAETLFLVGDRLNPWISYRIRAEVERRVFMPLFHDPIHFGWESRTNNWSAVCGGAVGMAVLLLEDDKERVAGMMERVIRSLECFLEGFGEDGGCAEGVSYWFYGFGYYVYFADMLFHYTDGGLDLLSGDKIRAIASFPAAVTLSGGVAINYSDVGKVTMHSGLLSMLANRLDVNVPEFREVPSFKADGCYRWVHVVRNLLWTQANRFNKPLPDEGLLLKDLSIAVDRRRTGETLFAFSAKGGHNDEPHNHNDLGHFILHIGGENLLADPGAGLYTKEYFGQGRYEWIHNAASGHSVPIINEKLQQHGSVFQARTMHWDNHDQGTRFSLDLTHAYNDPSILSFQRDFQWNWHPEAGGAHASLLLTDSVAFTGIPVGFMEQFVSMHEPKQVKGEWIWRGNNGFVSLQYDNDHYEAVLDTQETVDFEGENQTIFILKLKAIKREALIRGKFLFSCFGLSHMA
ncbi:heparinase II/III family protein [Paenibacillus agaridevorans]|uniref:heparinase II/III family protein n=1 Tax=Paenibacillus agaridevorans TaxID=171404 RepID=UPI001BE4CB34|nr:heparinase II/III family protein [Paenibacillus agaridevorans]